jgi:hypothetical protein
LQFFLLEGPADPNVGGESFGYGHAWGADYTPPDALATQAYVNARVVAATSVYSALAKYPDTLISGTITRDSNGAVTSAPVTWPDGTPGTFTADTISSTFLGCVDAYHITYGSPVTKTYTQPLMTRDVNGSISARPTIVVI